MKKFLLIAVAAFGMLMTACSKDEVAQPVGGEESVVTFTVEAPVMQTRAEHGDGKTATELNWAVYDKDGIYLFGGKDKDGYKKPLDNELKATVEIPFVNGMAYNILFWAEAPGTESPYKVDWEAKTVGYTDADALKSNSQAYDAFYAYVNDIPVITGPVTKSVVLKRPFAQLNIKTNDAKEAKQSGVEVEKVAVTVKKGYNAFNFVSGNGININQDAVTFCADAAQAAADDDGVQLLAVNYLFTGGEKSLVDVEFTYTDKAGKLGQNGLTQKYATVPVKRNYRTNIVGSLLTSEGKFNIETLPGFTTPDHEVSIWDGVSTKTPVAGADGVIRINSAEEFVGLMEVTGNSIFIGKTILLELDIDLKGNAIKGIGGDDNFAGVFDGQGHTVSNFTLDATPHRDYYAGLFNQVSHGGTIKNLTVKNAIIKGKSMVGAVASSLDSNATVENCKAIGCTLIGVKKVGSVVGYSAGSTVKDNYAENCRIVFSEKEAGEVLGYENTGSTVSGNTFKNITFVVSATDLATELTPDANGVITLTRDYTVTGDWTSLALSGTVTIEGNNHTIKGINQPLVAGTGGINITVKDLTIANSKIGVAANENGLGTGAFLCFIDAYGSAAFNNCHLVASTVTGNERAGGLIGYTSGKNLSIKNCTVVDCEIKAVGGAAGLVAYTQSTTTVENSKVENTTIESTEDRTGKTALAGAVIGTVTANTTFTNVTVSGNTVKNNRADAHSDMVGRVVSGKLTIDGQTVVSNAAALKAAITSNATSICIKGEIDLKDVILSGYNGTIFGADDTAVLNTSNFTPSRDEAYQLRSQNLTFKNISFKLPTNINLLQSGFVGTGAIVFDNCSFEGQATLNGSATWTFNNCSFVSVESGYYASFVYGATKATYNECTFSGVDRAAKVYGSGGTIVAEYNECKFTSSSVNKNGIEIDASYATTTVNINNCSQTGMAGLYALEGSKGTVNIDNNL